MKCLVFFQKLYVNVVHILFCSYEVHVGTSLVWQVLAGGNVIDAGNCGLLLILSLNSQSQRDSRGHMGGRKNSRSERKGHGSVRYTADSDFKEERLRSVRRSVVSVGLRTLDNDRQ